MTRAYIRITGLDELRAELRKAEAGLPKVVRVALNKGSALVIDYAKPRIPQRSGRARSSLKVRSSQTEARIAAGGQRAPYYPWLDFGGSTGRGKSVHRPFYKEGRYVYPGLRANRDEITEVMAESLDAALREAGLEVT